MVIPNVQRGDVAVLASVVERRGWASRVQAQMKQQLPAASRIVVFAGVRYRENLIG